ncbi:hypothetical protein DL764_010984 [Monosporascus ibericus]|uniref:Uncharacterized protein n=1 Tax=Monosporascus ibericus TaxID=155417 RepID=A0A4Q4SRP6_9PEZI|nr:hypothetical protein DL764_010984 [Monosporascus ibericus]
MERPEPGLIKWSPNPAYDSFIHINLTHRLIQLYEPTGHAQHGRFNFKKLSRHEESPPLTTYDWSPRFPGLVALGTANGAVNLLRIDDNSNGYHERAPKLGRMCQAIAFNTGIFLAVGYERVRNDHSLHIWDVGRLLSHDPATPGLPKHDLMESSQKLEAAVSVSSIKFFEDNPATVVAGLKNQGIRIYDLRDPAGGVINFQTKCNNNLAIDYADQNYFASSSLDQPGVLIWDRRATSRPSASPLYLDAVDNEDLPWGAGLKIDRATDVDPVRFQDRYSLIRSLRFSRDQRGLLAVLSRTGQLKVFETRKEFTSPQTESAHNPELLKVRRSYELARSYELDSSDHSSSRKDDRADSIVSFDWVNLSSPVLSPRAVVLRANGSFDILEKPSYTSQHLYKMVPWQTPYRGLAEGSSYHTLMQFDAQQYPEMMSSLLIDDALADVPLFGSQKKAITPIIQNILHSHPPDHDIVVEEDAPDIQPDESFKAASTTAAKLRGIRRFLKDDPQESFSSSQNQQASSSDDELNESFMGLSITSFGQLSNRQLHEKLLALTRGARGLPKGAQAVLDHVMLLRAKENYLFDCASNREIVADDPWLQDLWDWIAGAEEAAADSGMLSSGVDFGYLGVYNIWFDDLGARGTARLGDGVRIPDAAAWERLLQTINKRSGEPLYKGVDTRKPAHRQAAMRVCSWGRSRDTDFRNHAKMAPSGRDSSWYTMTAAHALFEGDSKLAVQILKTGSSKHPELLFVSLALQLIGRGDLDEARGKLDFDEAVASKSDPYLRAISSLIATNDWEIIVNQESLPLRERTFVAVRNFDDYRLTKWLDDQLAKAIETGDIEGIVLTGITDRLVDIFAKYVEKFNDVQTATLVLSICWPRYIDDYRCHAWRNAYRAYLQRHKAFFQRTKFEVESTKKSKLGGVPKITSPSRQIALRCVYCDADYELSKTTAGLSSAAHEQRNPLMAASLNAGVSCPSCGRHLPRCVVCLEIVAVPRSDKPEAAPDPEVKVAARFPTFCLRCEHVLHLDHARQWFSRHVECPVPECRCRCAFRANPELNYV